MLKRVGTILSVIAVAVRADLGAQSNHNLGARDLHFRSSPHVLSESANAASASAPAVPLTGLAALNLADDSQAVVTYWQNSNGDIVETSWPSNDLDSFGFPAGQSQTTVVNNAVKGLPIAAISYPFNGYPRRHLFYFNSSGGVSDITYTPSASDPTPSWQPGTFPSGSEALFNAGWKYVSNAHAALGVVLSETSILPNGTTISQINPVLWVAMTDPEPDGYIQTFQAIPSQPSNASSSTTWGYVAGLSGGDPNAGITSSNNQSTIENVYYFDKTGSKIYAEQYNYIPGNVPNGVIYGNFSTNITFTPLNGTAITASSNGIDDFVRFQSSAGTVQQLTVVYTGQNDVQGSEAEEYTAEFLATNKVDLTQSALSGTKLASARTKDNGSVMFFQDSQNAINALRIDAQGNGGSTQTIS